MGPGLITVNLVDHEVVGSVTLEERGLMAVNVMSVVDECESSRIEWEETQSWTGNGC